MVGQTGLEPIPKNYEFYALTIELLTRTITKTGAISRTYLFTGLVDWKAHRAPHDTNIALKLERIRTLHFAF